MIERVVIVFVPGIFIEATNIVKTPEGRFPVDVINQDVSECCATGTKDHGGAIRIDVPCRIDIKGIAEPPFNNVEEPGFIPRGHQFFTVQNCEARGVTDIALHVLVQKKTAFPIRRVEHLLLSESKIEPPRLPEVFNTVPDKQVGRLRS